MALDSDAVAVQVVRELAALTSALPAAQVVHTLDSKKIEAVAPSVWCRVDVMPGSWDRVRAVSTITAALLLEAAPAQPGAAAPFKRTGAAAQSLVEAVTILSRRVRVLVVEVAGTPVRISIPSRVTTPRRLLGNAAGHANHQMDLTFSWSRLA